MPGSLIRVQHGKKPGEVVIVADSRRSSREWIRTVLVGIDGGTVFAMLKQVVTAAYDERMAVAVPDVRNAVGCVVVCVINIGILRRLWERAEPVYRKAVGARFRAGASQPVAA